MTLIATLKLLHVCCAMVSIAGFTLRGYWALTDNPLRQTFLSRVIPHVVDTLLLGSAIGMLVIWGGAPLEMPWVIAKVLALLVYIGLGMMVMRIAVTRRGRLLAYLGALTTAAYILTVALSHSPWGLLAGLR
jgi:uncharacterized membrane protein SirB2